MNIGSEIFEILDFMIPDAEKWSAISNQTSQERIYTFDTAGKYVDRNIVFKINIPGVEIPTPATGESQFYITIGGVTYTWHVDSHGNV